MNFILNNNLGWKTIFEGPELSCSVDKLVGGKMYYFRGQTICGTDKGPWSAGMSPLFCFLKN